MEKLIITAAITGSRIPRSRTPYIPITPEEIAQSAYECWEAGASIAHIHVRDPETAIGTQDAELIRRVVEPLREKTDLVLCLTTSGVPGLNFPLEKRMIPLRFKPELASLDAGAILLGGRPFRKQKKQLLLQRVMPSQVALSNSKPRSSSISFSNKIRSSEPSGHSRTTSTSDSACRYCRSTTSRTAWPPALSSLLPGSIPAVSAGDPGLIAEITPPFELFFTIR